MVVGLSVCVMQTPLEFVSFFVFVFVFFFLKHLFRYWTFVFRGLGLDAVHFLRTNVIDLFCFVFQLFVFWGFCWRELLSCCWILRFSFFFFSFFWMFLLYVVQYNWHSCMCLPYMHVSIYMSVLDLIGGVITRVLFFWCAQKTLLPLAVCSPNFGLWILCVCHMSQAFLYFFCTDYWSHSCIACDHFF